MLYLLGENWFDKHQCLALSSASLGRGPLPGVQAHDFKRISGCEPYVIWHYHGNRSKDKIMSFTTSTLSCLSAIVKVRKYWIKYFFCEFFAVVFYLLQGKLVFQIEQFFLIILWMFLMRFLMRLTPGFLQENQLPRASTGNSHNGGQDKKRVKRVYT